MLILSIYTVVNIDDPSTQRRLSFLLSVIFYWTKGKEVDMYSAYRQYNSTTKRISIR